MTSEQFTAAAELLHGQQHVLAMATTLGVTERTVRRWKSGESTIPKLVTQSVLSMMFDRIKALNTCAALIETEATQ